MLFGRTGVIIMNRQELITSKEYWIGEMQLDLYKYLVAYMTKHKLTRKGLADKLGVSKGYVSQILNGNFDHRISKLVELALAIDKVPRMQFIDVDIVLQQDEEGSLHDYNRNIVLNLSPGYGITPPIQPTSTKNTSIKHQEYNLSSLLNRGQYEKEREYDLA
jgi:transcriptional regulator with XRE-family HTH domain